MLDLKRQLHAHCLSMLQKRIEAIDLVMAACQDAANSESKTTAGDKHETGRAVAQLDRENHAVQRVAALQSLQALRHIDVGRRYDEADTGALLHTDKGYIFLGISAGSIELNGESCLLVSVDSPIGQAFLGAEEGDFIQFREREFEVLAVS